MKENLVRRGKEEQIICGRKSKGRKIFGKGNYFEGREIYKQPKKQLKVQYIGIFEEIDSFY